MSKGKDLLKNTAIYSIGSIGSKVLSFALLPLYSYYLTKGELGTYDIILSTINILIPIISLQVSQAIYRWLLDIDLNNKSKIRIIISSGIAIVTLLNIIFTIIYCLSITIWDFPFKWYIIFVLFTSSYFQLVQDISRGLKKNKIYAIVGIINAFLLLLFTIIFLIVLNFKVEGLLLATTISSFISILFVCWKIKLLNFISFKFYDKKESKQMLLYSFPLIPNTISWWLINTANRYIILYGCGIEANGIYAISARFPAIITIFNSIFMLAWQDHIIQNKSDLQFAGKIFDKFIKLELGITIILISLSKYIVLFLFDNSFIDSWKYMGFLFIAAAFSAFSAYYGASYLSEKKTKGIFTTTIIGGFVNVVISFLLIKRIGLFAPAIGTLIGFFVVFILRIYQTKTFFNLKIDIKSMTMLSLCSIMFLSISFCNIKYIQYSIILLSIAIFIKLNMDTLKKTFSIIKNFKK